MKKHPLHFGLEQILSWHIVGQVGIWCGCKVWPWDVFCLLQSLFHITAASKGIWTTESTKCCFTGSHFVAFWAEKQKKMCVHKQLRFIFCSTFTKTLTTALYCTTAKGIHNAKCTSESAIAFCNWIIACSFTQTIRLPLHLFFKSSKPQQFGFLSIFLSANFIFAHKRLYTHFVRKIRQIKFGSFLL